MPIPVLSRMLGANSITVTIDPTVALASRTGSLTVTGTVASSSRGFVALSCQLVQTHRSVHRSEAFFQFVEIDHRRSTRFTVTLPNASSPFGPGEARIFGSATVIVDGHRRGFAPIDRPVQIR